MTSTYQLDISAFLNNEAEICGRCGRPVVMIDRFNGNAISTCRNKTCDRQCKCLEKLKDRTKSRDFSSADQDECFVHWKCDCRRGTLCTHHRTKPDLVVIRYSNVDKNWSLGSGFYSLYEQAKQWHALYEKQRKKALEHCGSCWTKLKSRKDKEGRKSTYCPKGCQCHCGDGYACYVHFNCGCLDMTLCRFHEKKRPDIAVALYNALPPSEPAKLMLSNSFIRANIDRLKYKRKGRKPKELKIVATVAELKPRTQEKGNDTASDKKRSAPAFPSAALSVGQKEENITSIEIDAKLQLSSKSISAPPEKGVEKRFSLAGEFEEKIPLYKKHLANENLSSSSSRNYVSRLNAFVAFLKASSKNYSPLSAATKNQPVADLKRHLEKKNMKPATINSYLSAIDSFYTFLGVGASNASRDEPAQSVPSTLTKNEQRKFLRAVELTRRVKDKAIANLLFHTGLRLSECSQLEISDVYVTGHSARVVIRDHEGGKDRAIPLNTDLRQTIAEWLLERKMKYAGKVVESKLFLNPQGKKMPPNSMYEVIRKIGRECGLELTPHMLRDTAVRNFMKCENDVSAIAKLAGHRSLNSTKKYLVDSKRR